MENYKKPRRKWTSRYTRDHKLSILLHTTFYLWPATWGNKQKFKTRIQIVRNLYRESYKVWPENLLPHAHTYVLNDGVVTHICRRKMVASSERISRSSSKLSSHLPWPTYAASFGTYHFRQFAQTLPSWQWRSFHCSILFWKNPQNTQHSHHSPHAGFAVYALSIFARILAAYILVLLSFLWIRCLHFCFLTVLSSFGSVLFLNFVIAAKRQVRLTSQ